MGSIYPERVVIGLDGQESDPMRRRTFLLGGVAALGGATAAGAGARSVSVGVSDPHGFATAVTERWPATRAVHPVPDLGIDWQLHLPGGRAFDGATTAIQVHPSVDGPGDFAAARSDPRRLAQFTRSRQRGLLVAADESSDEGSFYGLDARECARQATRRSGSPGILVPRAYLLDDLTYGALWAVSNADEALLADDDPLHRCHRDLAHYEGLAGSAVSREEAPDLAAVSQLWLGSEFCARYIVRNLDRLTHAPLFWTREQRGEEASAWLLWKHKLAYLRRTGGCDGTPVVRGFCVPEHLIDESPRHERVLLLLSAALMEAFGIRIRVLADPGYSRLAGFVLGGRAIIANWVRTPGIWQVDTRCTPQQLGDFIEASGDIGAHSVVEGQTPERRLNALADYLRLPWGWVHSRCLQLGTFGFDGLVHPRSRLLTVDGLNVAARYLGKLTPPG